MRLIEPYTNLLLRDLAVHGWHVVVMFTHRVVMQVKADGWIRLSLLDTYWGYLAQPWPVKREQAWICLTDTAGMEQLREVTRTGLVFCLTNP